MSKFGFEIKIKLPQMKKGISSNRYPISDTKLGFTLIEIMVAIGIVGILAAVILVSLKSFGAKGRAAKALGQLSSVLPAMYSCWVNGGTVNSPSSGGDICNLASSYGKWPSVGSGTDLSTYSYGGTITDKLNWSVYLDSSSSNDNVRVCCNSAMKSCKIIGSSGSTCNATTPSN